MLNLTCLYNVYQKSLAKFSYFLLEFTRSWIFGLNLAYILSRNLYQKIT